MTHTQHPAPPARTRPLFSGPMADRGRRLHAAGLLHRPGQGT